MIMEGHEHFIMFIILIKGRRGVQNHMFQGHGLTDNDMSAFYQESEVQFCLSTIARAVHVNKLVIVCGVTSIIYSHLF